MHSKEVSSKVHLRRCQIAITRFGLTSFCKYVIFGSVRSSVWCEIPRCKSAFGVRTCNIFCLTGCLSGISESLLFPSTSPWISGLSEALSGVSVKFLRLVLNFPWLRESWSSSFNFPLVTGCLSGVSVKFLQLALNCPWLRASERNLLSSSFNLPWSSLGWVVWAEPPVSRAARRAWVWKRDGTVTVLMEVQFWTKMRAHQILPYLGPLAFGVRFLGVKQRLVWDS